jgi:hypothetical protein
MVKSVEYAYLYCGIFFFTIKSCNTMTTRNQTFFQKRLAATLPLLSAHVLPSLPPLLARPLEGILFYGGGYYPHDPYAGHDWRGNHYHEDWWGNRRRYGPHYDPDPWGFWQGVAMALTFVLIVGAIGVYHLLKN